MDEVDNERRILFFLVKTEYYRSSTLTLINMGGRRNLKDVVLLPWPRMDAIESLTVRVNCGSLMDQPDSGGNGIVFAQEVRTSSKILSVCQSQVR